MTPSQKTNAALLARIRALEAQIGTTK